MNRIRLWTATLVIAVAAGVAFLVLLIWSSPPGSDEGRIGYGITMAALATPWALAAGILWHAWWVRAGARLSAMDAPARLLATAVATLPVERRDWGAAMTAELAQVPDREARWRFAAGCAGTAVFPPRHRPLRVLAAAALATTAVIVTGFAVGDALPRMRVFAVTFVVLVGALTIVAVARSRRLHRLPQGSLITIAGVAGVAACVVVTGYALRTDASEILDRSGAITLAVALGACLWLTLAPPQSLTTSKHARWIGVAAGLVLGGVVFPAARFNDVSDGGVLRYLANVPLVIFMVAALASVIGRSFAAGLQATVWAVIVTCLLAFAIFVVESLRWYEIHQTSLLDGDGGAGGTLSAAIVWILLAIPAMALPCGVVGAAVGAIGVTAGGTSHQQPASVGPQPVP